MGRGCWLGKQVLQKGDLIRKESFTEKASPLRSLSTCDPFGTGISPKQTRNWHCIYFHWKANVCPAVTALLPSQGWQQPVSLPSAGSSAVLWEDTSQQQKQQSSSLQMRKHF